MIRSYSHIAAVSILLGLSFPAPAQTSEEFFNDNVLHEVRIEMHPSDWQRLRDRFLDNTYYDADFSWNGVKVFNVGVRSRGRGSRSPEKPGIRVDFNINEENQEFAGLKSFILDNLTQDPSMIRERVSMALFSRMGLPAPRQAHTRLFINGQYWGVYGLVESIDKTFLKRHFKEDEGYLYEYKVIDSGYHFEYLGPDLTRYSPVPFDPKTHEKNPDPAPIERMIRTINQASDSEFQRAASEFLDLRLFMTHVAIETTLSELDGILGDVFGMNNFYFYRFQGKALNQFLVWDKDLTFDYELRPIFQNADQNVLMRRALQIPDLRNAYLEALAKSAILAGGPEGWLDQEILRVYYQIHDAVLADPKKQCSVSSVLRSCSNEEFEAEVTRLRKFVSVRSGFVLREVAAAGYQFSGAARLAPGGAVNAAPGGTSTISPGSLISVYGDGLTNATAGAESLPLPTVLRGVSIVMDGFFAPLSFVSPTQVNVQAPWEVLSNTPSITALVNGVPTNSIFAVLGTQSPGIFAIVHADGSLASSRPAAAGDHLVIFAGGLGPVTVPVATGRPAPSSPLAETRTTPRVTVGGVAAEVLFSGLTPGFVGLYQVNLKIPVGVLAGAGTPLVLSIGAVSAPSVPIPTR